MKGMFSKSRIRYISVLLLLTFPAACVPHVRVSVDSPPNNEYTTTTEVPVEVNFTGEASLLHVYQNDVEITSQLAIDSTGGTATGTVSTTEGVNTFEAVLSTVSDSSTIFQLGEGWEELLTPEAYNQAVDARYYPPIANNLMAYAEALGYEPTPLRPIEFRSEIFRCTVTYVEGSSGGAYIVSGRWNVYGPGSFGGIWRDGAEPGIIEILNPHGSFTMDCRSDECTVGEIVKHSGSKASKADPYQSCYDNCSLKIQKAMIAAMATDVACYGCLYGIAGAVGSGGYYFIPGILCIFTCLGAGWTTYTLFAEAEGCVAHCDLCTYTQCNAPFGTP